MKLAVASVLAGLVLTGAAPAAASTRFDMIFTATTSTFGPTAPASGVGYVIVEGYSGVGTELFSPSDPIRFIGDFQVTLALASFDFSSAAPGFPILSVTDGIATNFTHNGYKFGSAPAPSLAVFSSLGPGAYQLVVPNYIYTGVYSLKRYDPPTAPALSAPSAAPEPAAWATMVVGFFTLGSAIRATKRRSIKASL